MCAPSPTASVSDRVHVCYSRLIGVRNCVQGFFSTICQVTDCNANFHISGSSSCAANQCVPGTVQACPGYATVRVCSQVSQWSACSSVSCPNGTTPDLIQCNPNSNCTQSDHIACLVPLGIGSTDCVNGIFTSTCGNIVCNPGNNLTTSVVNGTLVTYCTPALCTAGQTQSCDQDIPNGLGTRSCVNGVWGSCIIQSCDPGYAIGQLVVGGSPKTVCVVNTNPTSAVPTSSTSATNSPSSSSTSAPATSSSSPSSSSKTQTDVDSASMLALGIFALL